MFYFYYIYVLTCYCHSLFYCCIIFLKKKVLEELYGQGRLCDTSITIYHQCERYLVVGLVRVALFPLLASLLTISSGVDFLFSINNCCLCIPQKIATIFMYFTCKSHLFLLLYRIPPQKASGRTGWSGPTFQHLHRQPPSVWTLSRCGTMTFCEWLCSLFFL